MNLTTRLSRSGLIAAAITMAMFAVAVAPGGWRTALAQTAGTVVPTVVGTATPTTVATATTSQTTTATNPDLSMTLTIPGGTFSQTAIITITPQADVDEDPTSAASQAAIAAALVRSGVTPPPGVAVQVFQLDAASTTGADLDRANTQPIPTTIVVAPQTIALAGGAANIRLNFYDTATVPPRWVTLIGVAGTATAAGTPITFQLPHFSTWALTVVAAVPPQVVPTAVVPPVVATTVPPTVVVVPTIAAGAGAAGVPAPAATGMGIGEDSRSNMLPIVAGILVLALAGGIGARRYFRS